MAEITQKSTYILDIRCDGRDDNTKEQCSCISSVVPSKQNAWVKTSENNKKNIIGISIAYCRVHQR